MGTLSADVDLLGDRLRQAVERFHGRELKEIAPMDRIAGAGAALGCFVCPTAAALRRYGHWEAALHESGHFAISPRFLWDTPAHADAAAVGERPPLPDVQAFALAQDSQGKVRPWGYCHQNDRWIESPHPLTDWHVRAWQWWAAKALRLGEPSSLWLQTTPWHDLLFSAEFDHPGMDRPGRWCDRHPERTEIWRERAAMPLIPERELAWRLGDVFHAPWFVENHRLLLGA